MKLPNKLLSLCLATACATLASCGSTTHRVVANDSYMLSIVDDTVSVRCHSPMPIAEFLQMAQTVTNGMYTFREDEMDGDLSWVGTINCQREEFDGFVQAMLKTKGLAVHARHQGDMEILEVRSMKNG